MKLFKRFFLLKKGIGAAAVAIGLFAFASCENMTTIPAPTMTVTATKTLYAPTFPEKTDEQGNLIPNLTYGERYYTVSQGLKRKITLSWNPVEIAKYYEIYSAQNINDTFIKVGESTKAEFEDSVASGMTCYYKVRAVNTKGECSDFSPTVRGTSLATPAITQISITDTEAKLFWYMGNVGVDSYVKNLVYEIHAFKGSDETIVTLKAWNEDNQSVNEEYTFENLTGNSEYYFRVDAYITSDQTQIESSPKVSEKTLALYTPVSPEFTASQGESVEAVKIFITLPSKVQVALDKETNEDFPICFEIQRKRNDGANWETIVPCLYFTGKTEKPTKSEYDDYAEGNMAEWQNKINASANSLKPGIRYDYRIISCVDLNYAKVNNFDYNTTVKSRENLAKTATGWAANTPTFEIVDINRTPNQSNPDLISKVSVTFNAKWDSLGKDDLYKFAIQQTFQKEGTSAQGTTWLKTADKSEFFDSIEAIKAYAAEYDLSIGAEFLTGFYQYTLYIISKEYETPSDAVSVGNYLVAVADLNNVTITPDANVPDTNVSAEGGWTNKVEVSWFPDSRGNVSYSLKRFDITDGNTETPIAETTILAGLGMASFPTNGKVTFTDTTVESGHEYAYELYAVRNGTTYHSSKKAHAKTLGTAVIAFGGNTPGDYSYDTIKVSWPTVMAAKTYDITLGEADKFGGGKKITLNEDGTVDSSNFAAGSVETKLESETITLTITNPEGYNDALKSGAKANLTVSSNSGKATTSQPEPVWTIGPASAATQGSDDNGYANNYIVVTWQGIKGAAGYAVYRTRKAILGTTLAGDKGTENLADQKTDVYYISADGATITANGDAPLANAVKVDISDTNYDFDTTYTLTDKYAAVTDNTKKWQVSQSYIGLGVEYNYTILPVLAQADAKDVESLDATAWDSQKAIDPMTCPQYANLSDEKIKKDGYTSGYGLNLEATKAEYTDRVVLMWDKPANIEKSERHPIIYYKKRNASGWNKIVDESLGLKETNDSTYEKNYYVFNSSALKQTLDQDFDPTDTTAVNKAILDSERLESFEFVVSYQKTFSGTSDTDKAYIEYLEKIKDERITTEETKNVGYLFTIPGIASCSRVENDDFSETVTWQKYNALTGTERAVEPDSYVISLKNLNNGSKYNTLVTYDTKAEENKAKTTKYNQITILPKGKLAADRTVTVTPSFNTSGDVGVHNGLLKVQRDYKHYYKLTASRKSKQDCYKFDIIKDQGFVMPADEIIAEDEDYAYRKISNSEFAKCVTLIVADALHKVSGKEGTLKSEYGSGTFKTNVPYKVGTPAVYNIEYKFENFKNIFAKLPGSDSPLQSDFILNGTSTKKDGYTYSNIVYQLGSCAITVTHSNGLQSYEGTVTLAAGRYHGYMTYVVVPNYETKWDLSLKFKNQTTGAIEETVTASDDADKFKLWFPFALWTDLGETQNDGTGSFPTMSDTWWQVQ